MKILLFGGTGQLGRKVLDEALKKNLKVTAVCRSPEKLSDKINKNLVVIKGDALHLNMIEEHFKEKDVIVSCLGEYKLPFFTVTLYSEFTKQAIERVHKYHIKKLIVCSSSGTVPSERYRMTFLARWVFVPLIGSVLSNMYMMEKIIKDSDINYVVIRPTGLIDCKIFKIILVPYTGKYTVEECSCSEKSFNNIHLLDLADFFIKCVIVDQYDRKMITVSTDTHT
ncbi:hypothetical protein HZS_4431 [Henneguya salminicola]|nr:hypothetical protein HZS_4431 [Henneguya salminicola]